MRQRKHVHSGAMSRFDSRARILDHQALRWLNRIALAQQEPDTSERRDKQVGRGLAAFRVLGAEHVEKRIAQMSAAQAMLGVAPRRSGREHQWEPLGAFAHELGGAWVQPIAVEQGALEVENYRADHPTVARALRAMIGTIARCGSGAETSARPDSIVMSSSLRTPKRPGR